MKKIIDFTTIVALKFLLEEHHINVSGWGIGKAKTLEQLYAELKKGEAELIKTDGKLMRLVRNVNIFVYYTEKNTRKKLFLKEVRQVFTSGRTRVRTHIKGSLSEKLLAHQSVSAEAAARALEEELGVVGATAVFKEKETIEEESQSYPGLKCIYEISFFEVELTEDQYAPEGYVETQSDKSTYFEWVEVSN